MCQNGSAGSGAGDFIRRGADRGRRSGGDFFRGGPVQLQDKGKTVLTAEKKLVQLSGCAVLSGDAFPQAPVISGGTITVFGVKRRNLAGREGQESRWNSQLHTIGCDIGESKINGEVKYGPDPGVKSGGGVGFGENGGGTSYRSGAGAGNAF